jgi:hypothetical protein
MPSFLGLLASVVFVQALVEPGDAVQRPRFLLRVGLPSPVAFVGGGNA